MPGDIYFFSESEYSKSGATLEKIGSRGRLAMTFASLKLPILPGIIIDSESAMNLKGLDWKILNKNIEKIEKIVGKELDSVDKPLLYKIVISSSLTITNYPSLHNFGLTDSTSKTFTKIVGEDFCNQERLFFLKGIIGLEKMIAELENDENLGKKSQEILDEIGDYLFTEKKCQNTDIERLQQKIQEFLGFDIYSNAKDQLMNVLLRIEKLLTLESEELGSNNVNETAIIIQPMVYGNYGKDSASGSFYTRNIVTGEKKLQGKFYQEEFNEKEEVGKDINQIDKVYLEQMNLIARKVEEKYSEMRSIGFTIENKKLWVIDQRAVRNKSTQADIKTFLDLYSENKVKDKDIVSSIKYSQLNELLHPVIDSTSTSKLLAIEGGISGAPGAAIGRVFFSTESLLAEYKNLQQINGDLRLILCLTSSFAEDVKAIEVATGVLSTEGGYSAHASVVARQYGKISLVNTDMKIRGKYANIGDIKIKEGDYITLNVPYYGKPKIYIGQAELIEPDFEKNGLLEFIALTKKFVKKDFTVRANADSKRDAALALQFGAEGVGLCRTEHMFFQKERISLFRQMIIANDLKERKSILKKIGKIQEKDFYEIMKVMQGKHVTIRLLDAPLHEFVPHDDAELKDFVEDLNKNSKVVLNKKEVKARFDDLKEFNPMLGHRGCRIAVTFPEIYETQLDAILGALIKLKKEGINVELEIMIPLIMNQNEIKLIVYGKKIEGKSYKGLCEIIKDRQERTEVDLSDIKIGTMIEIPAAALGAGDIAKYADFFSFGTNDLTQTTIGFSRDDYNAFMPDYTQFDLLDGNPFRILNKQVKELIQTAVLRGRMTRPELKKGLCGEHGAVPENIDFCIEAGLDYVSCSAYSIPLALLAVAQRNLAEK